MTSCGQCGDGFDMEEDEGWSTCGGCERTMCETCVTEGYEMTCARCEKLHETSGGAGANMMEGHPLCEGCYGCECESCEMRLCRECEVPHKQECEAGTDKGKAAFALAAAKRHVTDTEAQLASVASQIEVLQSRHSHLKDTVLVEANKNREAAEKRVAEFE